MRQVRRKKIEGLKRYRRTLHFVLDIGELEDIRARLVLTAISMNIKMIGYWVHIIRAF